MNDLKNSSPDSANDLYISFRLVGDSSYGSEKNNLEANMRELLGECYAVDHEDPAGAQDREIVYRIERPEHSQDESMKEFFQALKELFIRSQRHLPSFTQGTEALT